MPKNTLANPKQRIEYYLNTGVIPPVFVQSGTAFQQRVWEALCTIPYGETRTYQQIATQINHPKAVRAVANAIGANKNVICIPCHRVIRSDGSLGGFAFGQKLKKKLLQMEHAKLKPRKDKKG